MRIQSVKLGKAGYHVTFEDGSGTIYPRQSDVLGVLAKPALIWWAANVERELCIEVAAECSESLHNSDFPYDAAKFRDFMETRLGEKKAHQKQSQKAKDIGSETHALVQHTLKHQLGIQEKEPEVSEPAALAWMTWDEWRQAIGFEPVVVETAIASVELETGGTVDAAGNIKSGEFLICDWKSSKPSKTSPTGIYLEHLIQVAFYRKAGIEMGLFPEDAGAAVVRLPKNEDDPVIQKRVPVDQKRLTAEECDRLAAGFADIRKVWQFMATNGGI